jgi:hypothetical protein
LDCLRIEPGIEMPGYCHRVAPRLPTRQLPQIIHASNFAGTGSKKVISTTKDGVSLTKEKVSLGMEMFSLVMEKVSLTMENVSLVMEMFSLVVEKYF